ncbi:MAG: cupin domain-containing protein [Pseudomonadota bacterium]
MKITSAETAIDRLQLQPHPEGGYYRETYRSQLELEGLQGFTGLRSCSTGIYFMLKAGSRSHLHRIRSDEMWHFYAGDPLKIVMLAESGERSEVVIGPWLDEGQTFQFVVPKGVWFGAEVAMGGSFSLVGCTVAPGFDFEDFQMANREAMLAEFPGHAEFLETFCIS